MLIQLWMAEEEFIQPSGKRILEDIGEEYFKTLLNRNFFEDEEMDECGNITSCKMHDLMHDLAQTAAGMDNYSIIRKGVDGAKISKSVIHASISKPLCQFPTSILNATSILKAKNLRTFISMFRNIPLRRYYKRIRVTYSDISEEDFAKFALTFESLRVLGLARFYPRNPNVLDPIGKLKQLRYLDLSYTDITTLPNSVCELQNLLTLKLHCCRYLTELPRDIKELKSLTHLENYGCYNLRSMPCGIGQLTCIRTLPLFVLGGAGACLSELQTLNNLRGDLEIRIHQSGAASVKFRKACLKEKQYLQTLKLYDAVSLEALQPNPNLKDLTIHWYSAVRFPSWMLNMGNSLPYIVKISVTNCRRCVRFPLFVDLRCLKELHLYNLDSLEYIDSRISGSSSPFSSSFKGWFPSLKKVNLRSLPELKEWKRVVNDGGNAKTKAVAEEPTQQLLSLDGLEKLTISGCPKLTSMPLHPNVEELKLNYVSGVLIESMTMAATVSPTAAATSLLPSSFTFSKLKSLQIIRCKDLVSLGEGWLENLTSLERLQIDSCRKLESLPQGLQHFTALKNLRIWNCPELNFSDEDNDMAVLRSLHWLQLSGLPKLAALPKALQHSTALETLGIADCPGLMTLPDWFGKLTSLRKLTISDCSELKSLPEGMHRLTALQLLWIWRCPYLSETCRKETGKDWPKIAHIPKIRTAINFTESETDTDEE